MYLADSILLSSIFSVRYGINREEADFLLSLRSLAKAENVFLISCTNTLIYIIAFKILIFLLMNI